MSDTAYKIKVMQAFEDGKKIQSSYGGKWEDNCDPRWDWPKVEYRIKPEPLELWVNFFPNNLPLTEGSLYVHVDEEEAEKDRDEKAKKYHFRQVLDSEDE